MLWFLNKIDSVKENVRNVSKKLINDNSLQQCIAPEFKQDPALHQIQTKKNSQCTLF